MAMDWLRDRGMPETAPEREGPDASALTYGNLVAQFRAPQAAPPQVPLASKLCEQGDFALDAYRYWCAQLGERPRFHRKQWEFFFICQALHERGLLRAGARGLGFGVGQEPLPAAFAARGCMVLATDQGAEQAREEGWAGTGQHAADLEALSRPALCDPALFAARVRFRAVDMNAIPPDFAGQFDFCWSACCFEHLGSLEAGMRFVAASVATLRPGGLAVHTTEFNMSSDAETIEQPTISLHRRRDIAALVERLGAAGHLVAPIDWSEGQGFADGHVDLPPYRAEPHLRLRIGDFTCTSIGLIVARADTG